MTIPCSIPSERENCDRMESKDLYVKLKLEDIICFEAFSKSLSGFQKFKPTKPLIAICDFTKASIDKRFVVIDLLNEKLLMNTYVAHGKNSGDLYASKFSNQFESLQSSKGFFRIGSKIASPKHGSSLLLVGLEKGLNENARARQIIMHGADYVSTQFIKNYGRLGRSYGCPALSNHAMQFLIPYLADGSLLYIYTKS